MIWCSLFEQAAAEFVALGACGGDGTVAAAATVAIAHGKPLLVLPGGTYNHFRPRARRRPRRGHSARGSGGEGSHR